MTLRVQNDTGTTSNANAYIDLDYLYAYFDDRYITSIESNYSEELAEGAIVRATDHVDEKFELKMLSSRLTSDQTTAFPRKSFYDKTSKLVTGIPDGVKKAICEYVKAILESNTGELNPVPEYDETGQNIKSKTTRIEGAITDSVTYKDDYILNTNRYYPKADDYLKKYLKNSSGSNVFFQRA